MNRHSSAASASASAPVPVPVTLMPGQWHFGPEPIVIRTLVGSCVALALWHPQRRLGGMCHYLLPERRREPGAPLQGRFGDEAVELMARAIRVSGTRTQDYVAHLYGGADTLPDHVDVKFNIGERNVEVVWPLIDRHGFCLEGVDVGDQVPRTVQFDVCTGEIKVTRGRNCKAEKH